MEAVISNNEFITNIAGRVRNLNLPLKKALWPLFEVVSNSIHAIEELGSTKKGKINITLDREGHDEALVSLGDVNQYFIKSFIITDNGIGFNERNYKSFLTAESDYKEDKGSKGIGRFVCLKAFKKIEYSSTYRNNSGETEIRNFSLKAYGKGFDEEPIVKSEIRKESGTKVILNSFYDEYKNNCPKSIDEIAELIIEHFFIYFIEGKCPIITIVDTNGNQVTLQEKFGLDLLPNLIKRTFKIKNTEFTLNLLLVDKTEGGHRVHYCGNSRDVVNEPISKYIPDLKSNVYLVESDQKNLKVYITSTYLDNNVGNERTRFNFPDNEEDAPYDYIVTFEDIKKQIEHELEEELKTPLEALREQKMASVKRHVEQYAPQFKYVLKYKEDEVKKLPATLTGEKLDVELFKIQQKLELDTKILGNEVLNGHDYKNVEEYQKAYDQYLEQSNDIGKSNLVKYVIHRRAIIDLLNKYLGEEGDKFQSEKTIHEIFFPIKKESDDVKYEQQNLWLIDERLAYHYYLASDKPMADMPVLENIKTTDRPDLFIFNSSFAFVNEEAPFNSFIIVEFKKPERNDYSDRDEKKNPVDQVIDYIGKLRSGSALDRRGKFIQVSDKDKIPFYAYVICDFNPKLINILTTRDYIITPDGMGYFYYHKQFNAYIEVISYQKLVKDARNRNRILFERLGISV
ncbi:MAG: ATP-binding protein [Stigonema ocellatum SAG 48.90 = DSM 106950]|uniref:ATP-binding protein n=1 Tax=Spirosoma sp. TaxID=1899569 RepID=UPI002608812B|nr:ATP-binding protein [Spirosoma sp.]MBR8837146.1 ATP-binding protein [Stigonema ocellatum SAG 48.90 = DSM 106950]MCX6213839.1 ATP-binding protein [Spirosoma sp.]